MFYNPAKHDPTKQEEGEPQQCHDDLFINCRAGHIRLDSC